MKTFKVEQLCIFCGFRCQFEIFFKKKTTFISSEKRTAQAVFAFLLNFFKILMLDLHRKIDKK